VQEESQSLTGCNSDGVNAPSFSKRPPAIGVLLFGSVALRDPPRCAWIQLLQTLPYGGLGIVTSGLHELTEHARKALQHCEFKPTFRSLGRCGLASLQSPPEVREFCLEPIPAVTS
jgi:hypothetical protein